MSVIVRFLRVSRTIQLRVWMLVPRLIMRVRARRRLVGGRGPVQPVPVRMAVVVHVGVAMAV